jgi:cytochrome c553
MRMIVVLIVLSVFCLPMFAADGPPAWAYNTDPNAPIAPPPNAPPAPPNPAAAAAAAKRLADPTLLSAAGSSLKLTRAQITPVADWFPGDHPPMPEIVAKGRQQATINGQPAQAILGCAVCHLANGKGRPENASVAGLPVYYFIQQMTDFKAGNHLSADPRKANSNRMAGFAMSMTDDEVKAAAEYFGAIKWSPWIRVVETDTVPKVKANGGLFAVLPGGEKEPIGQRIIEVPEDEQQANDLRNSHSGFIAYVPVGSVAKGKALVTTGGGGKTLQCGICHGTDLQGIGPVPPIAGRSASYIARELYDFQQGTRKGLMSPMMKPAVEKLSSEDILDISAYVASRPVEEQAKTAANN